MFKIKTKVFLPLFILIFGIAGYLYGVWIPETTAFSVHQSQQLVMRTLEIVEDQITQDIVDGRKEEATDRLDLILLKNPQWTKLVLTDEKGEVIFPQMGKTDLTESGALKLVSKKLDAYGKDIGMLHVLYDFTEIETTIGKHTADLMLLFGGLLTFFVGITALTLHFFVIRPAKILAESAQRIAGAKTVEEADIVVLPKATKDEIGKLVQSFADMKNTLRRKQNHLMNKNNELLLAKAKAEEANVAKSQFLANMSHELRTPMNGILGLAELLSESPMEEDQQESVNAILHSGETLMYLLNDILDFSKIEAGELILENIPFDMQEKMQNVVSLLKPMASKNGNVVGFLFADGTSRYVIGDPARICQIITNLVGNALKFTERGRVDLIVSVVKSAGESLFYQITVRDTGIGIPKDKQDKLFNKFVQADTSTSRKFGGTGLGLAICKELVDLMKGTIDLESEVGKGTAITVTIPLVEAKASQIPQKAENFVERDARSEVQADYSEFNLLVVDDHHVNMMFNRKLLKRMGFKGVDEATNGLDACKMYESFSDKYHMILMDCQMPEMDGFEATRRIREYQKARNLRQVPIIAMTAHAMQGDKELCLEAGMDDYISKPINPAKLNETLGKWLGAKKKSVQDAPQGSNVVGIDARKNKMPAKPLSSKKSVAGSGHHAVAEVMTQTEGKLVDFFYIDCFAEGDPEQERSVLAVFAESAESIIAQLHKIVRGEKTEEDWRKTSHKLKGLFVQIGAEKLGKICAQSEKMTDSSSEEKRQIVTEIEEMYQAVLKALSEYISRPR